VARHPPSVRSYNVESELDFCGVYRVTPDLGMINVLVRDADLRLPSGEVPSAVKGIGARIRPPLPWERGKEALLLDGDLLHRHR